MRWRRRVIEGIALLACAGYPRLGETADDPEALIRQGNDLRRAGDDVRAEGYLRRAYEVAHTPRSAAQLGLVEFALGKFAEANLYLTEALETSDAWVERSREVVETSRAEVRARLVRIDLIGSPSGATFAVGIESPRPVPADGRLWLGPGRIVLRVDGQGQRMTSTFGAKEGDRKVISFVVDQRAALTVKVQPSPSITPRPSLSAEPRGRTAAFVCAGVGILAAAGGAIAYTAASSKKGAIENAAATGGNYQENDGSWRLLDRGGMGLMVGGAAGVLGGAALFLLGNSGEPGADHPGMSIRYQRSGAFVSVESPF
jgi:hypothetical protein